MKEKTVFIGLSGGVDSAVSAALLKEQGYKVVGVFIRTWHPSFLECNEEEERLDAMRIAAHLDIPFLTFNFENIYKKEVADYMIAEYKLGRTPNPDVMCNKEVKFGAFLKKAIAMGADYVATGHYAKTSFTFSDFELPEGPTPVLRRRAQGRKIRKGEISLYKGNDVSKDQSYFLWTLKQEQLKKIIFPIGHLKKTAVRKLAKKFKLPVAEKKDSQGICFLGAVDLKEFLKHYIKEKKGKVLNEKGEEIGYHNGVFFYTLGERHGFKITQKSSKDGACYVIGKDVKKNILYVSQNSKKLLSYGSHPYLNVVHETNIAYAKESTFLYSVKLNNVNWIPVHQSKDESGIPNPNKNYTCQIRYHGQFLPCQVLCESQASAEILFKEPILVAAGQSCVLYDKDVCLGGGVVV